MIEKEHAARSKRGLLRFWPAAVVVLLVQAGAVLLYLSVEKGRRLEGVSPPRIERLVGSAPAADIELERPDGRTIRLSDLPPQPILLHFWATWCPPCRRETPALLEVSRDFGREEGLLVVSVSLDEGWSPLQKFFGVSVPEGVFLERAGEAPGLYGFSRLPTSYLLTTGRVPIVRFEGELDWRSSTMKNRLGRELQALRDQGSS